MGHKEGETQGGKPFTKGGLYRLLTNPIYTGNVEFKGQVYDGEHEPIVETKTWESVQEILHRNRGAAVLRCARRRRGFQSAPHFSH